MVKIRNYIIAIVITISILILMIVIMNNTFTDRYPIYTLNDGDKSPDGKWLCLWNGYGLSGSITDSGRDVFFMYPQTSTNLSQTASNLVISTQKFSDFEFTIDAKTVKQLRKNNPPNEWEVAWVIFRYTDKSHYYYFTVKTNGIELGKYDRGSQTFLYTANSPHIIIGKWSTWKINAVGNHIVIYVDGVKMVDYIDHTMSNQLKSGSIGMYDEDAYVMFGNVLVRNI